MSSVGFEPVPNSEATFTHPGPQVVPRRRLQDGLPCVEREGGLGNDSQCHLDGRAQGPRQMTGLRSRGDQCGPAGSNQGVDELCFNALITAPIDDFPGGTIVGRTGGWK